MTLWFSNLPKMPPRISANASILWRESGHTGTTNWSRLAGVANYCALAKGEPLLPHLQGNQYFFNPLLAGGPILFYPHTCRGNPNNLCGDKGPGMCYVDCKANCSDKKLTASAERLSHLLFLFLGIFLSDPGIPEVRSMGPDVCHSLHDFWNWADVVKI